jgi:hypothetical protein
VSEPVTALGCGYLMKRCGEYSWSTGHSSRFKRKKNQNNERKSNIKNKIKPKKKEIQTKNSTVLVTVLQMDV